MVTIPAQFNGPLRSANGGYACGLLAEEHGSEISTSTLREPPPLDSPMTWERDGDELRLVTAGGAIVGSVVTGSFAREPVPCPTEAEATTGLADYPGFHDHLFDHCFTCGTQRSEGDGLRIFPGPCGPRRTATPWTPHEAFAEADGSVGIPVTWAALDCPGGWSVGFDKVAMVLGRMTGHVLRRPRPGEKLLATGRLDAQEGRKYLASTALYAIGGELLGRAEQTWIQVDVADFS
jgi:hypothetical protein